MLDPSTLRRVVIKTTSGGPFETDLFWILETDAGDRKIPLGAPEEEALIAELQALPGFDNEAMILAMSSAGDTEFVCWERNRKPGKGLNRKTK